MNIDTREIASYIAGQKKNFLALQKAMPDNNFNEGIIAGLDLVTTYITIVEDREALDIARENSDG